MKRLGFFTMVLATVLVSVGPFFWIFLTALKSPDQIFVRPPEIWPDFDLSFFRLAFEKHNLFQSFVNSVIVAGATTIITITLASIAAYPLARMRFVFRDTALVIVLVSSMFPQIAMIGGVYRVLRSIGLLNTYPGLILPYTALTLPLAIWILVSFFKDIPRELEEAARVDGCGSLSTLWKIFFPVAAPAVFTAAILVFIYAWNEFFFALLIMTQAKYHTLPVGISLFHGQYDIPWGELSAATVVATLPLVIFVLFLQKKIISGLTAGSVKG